MECFACRRNVPKNSISQSRERERGGKWHKQIGIWISRRKIWRGKREIKTSDSCAGVFLSKPSNICWKSVQTYRKHEIVGWVSLAKCVRRVHNMHEYNTYRAQHNDDHRIDYVRWNVQTERRETKKNIYLLAHAHGLRSHSRCACACLFRFVSGTCCSYKIQINRDFCLDDVLHEQQTADSASHAFHLYGLFRFRLYTRFLVVHSIHIGLDFRRVFTTNSDEIRFFSCVDNAIHLMNGWIDGWGDTGDWLDCRVQTHHFFLFCPSSIALSIVAMADSNWNRPKDIQEKSNKMRRNSVQMNCSECGVWLTVTFACHTHQHSSRCFCIRSAHRANGRRHSINEAGKRTKTKESNNEYEEFNSSRAKRVCERAFCLKINRAVASQHWNESKCRRYSFLCL